MRISRIVRQPEDTGCLRELHRSARGRNVIEIGRPNVILAVTKTLQTSVRSVSVNLNLAKTSEN